MRRAIRSLFVVSLALIGVVGVWIASTITAAVTLTATALIVPGTGTPDANIVNNYLEHVRDYYLGDTPCGNGGCTNSDLQGINYPASFWPLAIFPTWCRSGPDGCDKWNESVGKGADALSAALDPYLDPSSTEQVVIFGYSQGGAVVSRVYQGLGSLDQSVKDRLQVVTIGGIENPDGGLWQRLGFVPYVPIFDINFGPPMPTNTGVASTTIGFQYDPVVYAPKYWGNPFALLNAFAGFENVHGDYLAPNGNQPDASLPYGYDQAKLLDQLDCTAHPSNCRYDAAGNTYVMLPATSLPLTNLVLGLAKSIGIEGLVKPFVDLTEPALKVLVDLGYDWSGDPGKVSRLSILPFNPFQNWFQVGANLINATFEGIQAFLGDLGISTAQSNVVPDQSLVAADSATPGSDSQQQLAPVVDLSAARAAKTGVTATDPAPKQKTDAPQATGDPQTPDAPKTEVTGSTQDGTADGTAAQQEQGTGDDANAPDVEVGTDGQSDDTKTDDTKIDDTKIDDSKIDDAGIDDSSIADAVKDDDQNIGTDTGAIGTDGATTGTTGAAGTTTGSDTGSDATKATAGATTGADANSSGSNADKAAA